MSVVKKTVIAAICAGVLSTSCSPLVSGAEPVAARRKRPALTAGLSICYSPYTNGLSPALNSPLTLEHLRGQLDLAAPYVDTIRLFGVTGELQKIYKPAKEEYKLRVIAGCWLDASFNEVQIYAELDALAHMANDGLADVAAVGSENIYRGDNTADEMAGYINYVRSKITDRSIPVGTSDTAWAFTENPRLVEACDVILCTIYPYFSGVAVEDAARSLAETYAAVSAAAKGRQVIISETGWPTQGSPEGPAIPSMSNAKLYFEDVYAWSRQEDVEVVFFSQIDEAWKLEGVNADIGGHWGHFTADGTLKEAYRAVYSRISETAETNG
ncbi:MAG: hypothetical protein LBS62_11080 [Clostridiales bacterium]|nr:hypothetical protein [Clostridiales bacterium]